MKSPGYLQARYLCRMHYRATGSGHVIPHPADAAGQHSLPDCLRRNFAVPTTKSKSARVSVRPVASDRVQIKALPSENEEELRGMADSASV